MKEITTDQEWHDLFKQSDDGPVLLLKHSTTCPISAEAYDEFQSFINSSNENAHTYAMVKVIESRPVSNLISEELGVKHESPQLFILDKNQVKWVDSHFSITKKKIEKALA
ncbi:bacillithiol system redox-active protein YtxJ [Alkalihalophilus pseudofirmus]|uniref:bacillithiol system redox-active protein YtxJ n=1 Tax=Alkalihalophilus pseudofirmus TaxID=79885 RepID=UPI000AF70EE1